ncbi:MAG: hypothetical protein VX458_00195 [Bacteroidota bacterium]|jgi:uncharacterized membrane protein|nr:hypothetical protein [Bacteroidota bacterium]
MKKVGLYLIIAFTFYLIGQVMWLFMIILDEPLFGSNYLDDIIINQVFTLFAIFGLITGITLYKLNK